MRIVQLYQNVSLQGTKWLHALFHDRVWKNYKSQLLQGIRIFDRIQPAKQWSSIGKSRVSQPVNMLILYQRIISNNFITILGCLHNILDSFLYPSVKTCIRRSKGMCCVEYQVCVKDSLSILLTDTAGTDSTTLGTEGTFNEGFSIDTALAMSQDEIYSDFGAFDAMCSTDYVEIPCKFRNTNIISILPAKYLYIDKYMNNMSSNS